MASSAETRFHDPADLSPSELARLEDLDAPALIDWAFSRYGLGVQVASSLAVEDVVLMHLAVKRAGPEVRVFTLDTGRLNQETYDMLDRVKATLGVAPRVFFPDSQAVERYVNDHGANAFYDSVELRKACCAIRKVAPLARALADAPAWLTGLRRDQSVTRAALRKVEVDSSGRVKVAPLSDWTEEQVWAYCREHRLPANALHAQGYPSIGCAPCTRAVAPGEHARAGRWWWEDASSKECGLHTKG